ncbi:hypothetical protein AB4099_31570 [Bosea sp. 2KB_26]|uniref:hypothetical protein n=1 Tax=Bosea sp. 2KB_26 TaxID=3237475 RepID=UPI000DE3D3A8
MGAFDDLVPNSTGKPGVLETAALSALQGLTFGFGDEGYGLTQGLRGWASGEGFGNGYNRGATEFREREKAGKEANPITATVAEIAGGMGTGLGLARTGLTLVRAGMSTPKLLGASALEGAGYGALSGAGNAEGGLAGGARGAFDGMQTGLLLGVAAPAVTKLGGELARHVPSPFKISPERQEALSILAREGVPLSAGQKTGNKTLQNWESNFGDATLAGGKASNAMKAQAEAFTDAAMRRAGGSGRASRENISKADARIRGQFDELSERNTFQMDPDFLKDLWSVKRHYGNELPPDSISGLVGRLKAGSTTMTGREYQTLRTEFAKNADQVGGNRAKGWNLLRDALDDNMLRSLSPDDAATWQAARRQHANLKDIKAAREDATTELISPQSLWKVIAGREADVGERALDGLARAGSQLMTPLEKSAKAQGAISIGQLGAIVSGTGNALEPATAAIMTLGPPVFGRALWSGPVQKYLAGEALTLAERAAINARLRAALHGGGQSQGQKFGLPTFDPWSRSSAAPGKP